MPYEQIRLLLLTLCITLISGVGDSLGFIHAAKMWRGGDLIVSELGKSALGFSIGVGSYWFASKYLNELGVLSPETQTLIWFVVTIVGIALISGKFLQWPPIDRIIAVVVILGVTRLLFRAS